MTLGDEVSFIKIFFLYCMLYSATIQDLQKWNHHQNNVEKYCCESTESEIDTDIKRFAWDSWRKLYQGWEMKWCPLALHSVLYSWGHPSLSQLQQPGKATFDALGGVIFFHSALQLLQQWQAQKAWGAFTDQASFCFLTRALASVITFSFFLPKSFQEF